MLPSIPNLFEELWRLIRQIPPGRFSTYGDVARALGDIAASRFVGEQMMHHDHQAGCCCHRLVRANRTLGKFITGDLDEKSALLISEGVGVCDDRVMSSERYWTAFDSDRPLLRLAQFQTQMASRVEIDARLQMPAVVGGVDVSLVPDLDRGVAAFVEMELATGEIGYQQTLAAPVQFPYIPGYLAFRELPLLLSLLEEVGAARKIPRVVIVDGSGILHPRRAGIAAMLGVAAGITTIGVTKKHLTGRVDLDNMTRDSVREVRVEDQLLGFAVLPDSGTAKPIYVSPGHGIDPVTSLAVLQACQRGRRLPEPIYWADRISRARARTP